ncbi:hypothetical protein MYX84_13245 [Acidobacteria bacterium AH-259-O06]|nr:hypothetical protein [Acidobacteria bacterium AH-259-O06]
MPEALTTLEAEKGERSHRWPQFLPGGKAVLFTVQTAAGSFDDANVEVLNLETGVRKILQRGGTYGRYVPSGHVVYVRGGTLFALPFDLDRLEVTGSPLPVLEEVTYSSGQGDGNFALSQTGTLVYRSGHQAGFSLVLVEQEGEVTVLEEDPGVGAAYPRLSPDGKRVALHIGASGERDVWIYDLERDTMTRLTFAGEDDSFPIWTPDGKRITFGSRRDSADYNVYWKPADGSGEAQRLTESENRQQPSSWSPDGEVLAFAELGPETSWDIGVLRLGEEGKTEFFVQTQFAEFYPRFSPDGRWVTYQSNESGRYEVYVRPFPGPGGRWQISTEGGGRPRWSPDGSELFYQQGDRMMVVPVTASGTTFRAGKPRELFRGCRSPD